MTVNPQPWETKPLIQCTADGIISYGIVQPGQHVINGIPIIRVNNFKDGILDVSDALRVAESVENNYQRTRLQGGEVLLTLVGSVGQIAIVPDALKGWNVARAVAVIRPSQEISARWLCLCLQSRDALAFLDGRANTTVQKTLNLSDVKQVPIILPPPGVRSRIEAIADCIEGKINLNRRINQTLEAMAQAIFKSWFVDFDPVKAKIAAKQTGQDPLRAAMSAISGKSDTELDSLPPHQYHQLATTATLFPDEMAESELGEIPKCWRPTPIRDVAMVVKGKSYSSKDLVENDQVALVTLKSFERGGGFRMDGFKPYIGSYKAEQIVSPGDLIVAYTDVTQAAELIGKPAIVVGVDHFKTLVASLDVGIVRPLNGRVSRQFLNGLFTTGAFQAHTFAHTSGTTVLHLSKEGVPSYIFACPDERLIEIYSQIADAMATEKQILLNQNQSLSISRDTLLPKLLSGELSVSETILGAGA